MKNNEFFNNMRKMEKTTSGEWKAFNAWKKGIKENQDFPVQADSMWEDEISDFLETLKKAGFKKFGFYGTSTIDLRNIVKFTKNGWKVTGTFKFNIDNFDGYSFDEGLTLEKD